MPGQMAKQIIIPKWHPRLAYWDHMEGSISVQVDCKPLADLLSGAAVLKDEEMRPLFIRIGRSLTTLFKAGWRSRKVTAHYIEWSPREYNTVADHIANVTMDRGGSWEFIRKDYLQNAVSQGSNLLLCTDGGSRETGEAAAAW
eukprot:1653866-Karenia_brevis.AAC.1